MLLTALHYSYRGATRTYNDSTATESTDRSRSVPSIHHASSTSFQCRANRLVGKNAPEMICFHHFLVPRQKIGCEKNVSEMTCFVLSGT